MGAAPEIPSSPTSGPPRENARLAICARSIGKAYRERSLAELLGLRAPADASTPDRGFRLRGIDLDVERGGSLAIIGRNGAGKSTLLRLLAGVSRPSEGSIVVEGSVRSLLDLGAGFFDDLTGRENASLVMGLDCLDPGQADLATRRAFDFADIGDFIDVPLRGYSSGMRIRLAYALAIAVRPDILVADEVLAVGDEEFQRRCSHHVRDFLAAGGSLVLASHNLYHVEKLCRDAIWLDSGRVRAKGPAREVTLAYRAAVEASDLPPSADETEAGNPSRSSMSDPDSASKPRRRFLLRSDGREGARLAEGRPVDLLFDPPAADGSRIEILRPNGVCVASLDVAGRGVYLEALPLLPGRYRVRLVDSTGAPQALGGDSEFDCVGSSRELGTVRLRHSWGDAVKSA